MGTYDFDQVIERRGSSCVKWDGSHCQNDPNMVALWVADMDFQVLPEIRQALAKQVEHGIFGYGMEPDGYRKSIQGWMKRRHDWDIEQEWILSAPGIVPAIKSIIQCFTNPKDEILIFSPVYYPFLDSIEKNGRTPVQFRLSETEGHYTIDFDALADCLNQHDVRMIIFCAPHNPIGRIWTEEELKKLGALCKEHEILMVSDEIHMDLAYPGHHHIPYLKANPDLTDSTIVCTAPSKTFNIAGLSVSNLMIPNHELREKLKAFRDAAGCTSANMMGYAACQAAYEHGDKWVDELMEYLDGNKEFVRTWLADNLPAVKLIEPEGLYLLWLDFRGLGMNEKELEEMMLKEAHVWLDEGYIFGPGGEGFERINIACPRSLLERALEQIKGAVDARS